MSTYRHFVRSDRKDSITQSMMYNYRHQSGFHVCFVAKPGFVRKFAAFGIPYGSAALRFMSEEDFHREREAKRQGEAVDPPVVVHEVPAGSAHYLEHCLFSQDDEGGLMGQFARLGAMANAYTSESETVYYFTCVDSFEESLDLYFRALLNPDLSEKRIEDEREIIAAELDMYEDDPDSVSMRQILSQLYHEHGIRHDVAGSKESINGITSEILQKIVDHFYTPAAMKLVIVGDFPEEKMRSVIDYLADILDEMDVAAAGVSIYADEPANVKTANDLLRLDVENESFLLAFKNANVNRDHSTNGSQWAWMQAAGQLYCDAVIGETTALYQDLYDSGLINDSFDVHFAVGHDYNYVLMSGEADQPKQAADEIARRFQATVAGNLLDREVFDIQKKALHGDFIRSLDNIEACGMAALEARLFDCDLFDHVSIFGRLNPEDAANSMKFVLDEGSMAKLILRKRGI